MEKIVALERTALAQADYLSASGFFENPVVLCASVSLW